MRQSAGFTLLEVMISLLVFSLVLAGMAPAFVAQIRHNTDSQLRTESIAAAQIVLDALRVQDPSTLPASGSDAARTINQGTHSFSVIASYCENATYCSTVNNRHVTVRVSYRGNEIFETQTVFTQLR